MNRSFVQSNGEPVAEGKRITPDHTNTTFVVQVRSLRPITASELKRVIESRYEVTSIQATDEVTVVQ